MGKRRVKDAQEARRLLAKAARFDGDLATFYRDEGVDGRSLNAWRKKFERGTKPASAPRVRRSSPRRGKSAARVGLVELVPTTEAAASANRARYTVRVGGAEVEVGDDFEADTLRRLLETLGVC